MSNHMGAGNARAARLSLKAALGVGTATVFATATAVFAGRSVWPRIFTPDSRIVALASSVLVILAVASIFDGIMCIFRGVTLSIPPLRTELPPTSAKLRVLTCGALVWHLSFVEVSMPQPALDQSANLKSKDGTLLLYTVSKNMRQFIGAKGASYMW